MRWAPRRIKQSEISSYPNHSMIPCFYNNLSGRHQVPGTAPYVVWLPEEMTQHKDTSSQGSINHCLCITWKQHTKGNNTTEPQVRIHNTVWMRNVTPNPNMALKRTDITFFETNSENEIWTVSGMFLYITSFHQSLNSSGPHLKFQKFQLLCWWLNIFWRRNS